MKTVPIQLLGATYAVFPKLWLATHLLVLALIPIVVCGFKRSWQFSREEWCIGLSFVGVMIEKVELSKGNRLLITAEPPTHLNDSDN